MQPVRINEKNEILDEAGNVIGKKDSSGKMVFTKPPTEQKQVKPPSEIIKNAVSYTKYEVTPQSSFTIRFCIGFNDDRVNVYTEDAYQTMPELERHWVKFRMWTYEEELKWKNQCMEYDFQSRSFKLNPSKLDELKIRNLIKDWSFAEHEAKFKLLHVNKVLSDESYDIFKGFFPTIINNIIFLMNQVLENNG